MLMLSEASISPELGPFEGVTGLAMDSSATALGSPDESGGLVTLIEGRGAMLPAVEGRGGKLARPASRIGAGAAPGRRDGDMGMGRGTAGRITPSASRRAR